jgi:hypothetical protein
MILLIYGREIATAGNLFIWYSIFKVDVKKCLRLLMGGADVVLQIEACIKGSILTRAVREAPDVSER